MVSLLSFLSWGDVWPKPFAVAITKIDAARALDAAQADVGEVRASPSPGGSPRQRLEPEMVAPTLAVARLHVVKSRIFVALRCLLVSS